MEATKKPVVNRIPKGAGGIFHYISIGISAKEFGKYLIGKVGQLINYLIQWFEVEILRTVSYEHGNCYFFPLLCLLLFLCCFLQKFDFIG